MPEPIEPTEQAPTTPTPGANGGEPAPGAAAAAAEQKPEPGKTFTQADLDRIVQERLERERAKYAGFDDLKKAAAKLKVIEDAQKTEAEKAAERLAQLEGEAQAAKAAARTATVQAAVVAAAAKARFMDPADAYQMLKDRLELAEDGTVKNLSDVLEALAKDKPYLVQRAGQPPAPAINPTNPGNTPVGRTDVDRRREYFGAGAGNFWKGGGVADLAASLPNREKRE